MKYITKSKLKRMTAVALAAAISAQLFTGCSDTATSANISGSVSQTPSDTPSGTVDEDTVIEAQNVDFNENGEYTTTLTSAEIDLSDIKAEDVTVSYEVVDSDGYIAAQDKANDDFLSEIEALAASLDDSGDDPTDFDIPEIKTINLEDFISSKNVEVKSVKPEKDKLELSFVDPDAAAELTGYYTISLNKKYNDEDITVDLSVNFKEFQLTPNIEYVLSNAEETRLTLELNGGSFADNVTKDDITLSGSFEDMKIDSLSCSGKNLTMQLVGKPTKPDGLAYVDGVVSVRPQAIKEAGCEVRAFVPIELIANSFDASTLKADGDQVTAELEFIGAAKPLDELKAEDIKFENDVTVNDVKKVDDTRVELTMTVNGAKDANSAADILNDQKLTIADDELIVSSAKAHFYPVFDAIEADGDDLKFTIIAYIENGSFSDDIKAEQIALGEDFESGKVVSAEKQNDTTAQIVFTVPANGQTIEDFSFDGGITLKAGAMNSAWGDASDEDYTCSRNFSMESLGRVGIGDSFFGANAQFSIDFPFGGIPGGTDLMTINALFNTHYEFFSRIDGSSTEIWAFRNRLNEIVSRNVIPADMDVLRSQTSAISKLRNVVNVQYVGMAMNTLGLGLMAVSFCSDLGLFGENKEAIDAFKKTEQRTAELKEAVQDEYHRLCGLKEAALRSVVTEFDVRLGDLQQYVNICRSYFSEKCCDDLGVEMPENVLADAKTTQFCYDVSVALTDACRNKDAGYESYQQDFNMLQRQFDLVCNQLLLKDGADPLTALDQAYANIDNFSTTSYRIRKAYRASVISTLEQAMNLIRWYKLASYKFETDNDDMLVIHEGENGEEDYYIVDEDTIDTTDEDLYDEAVKRLVDMPIYDEDDSLAEYEKEYGLTPDPAESAETKMLNSDYYNMFYNILTGYGAKTDQDAPYARQIAARNYLARYPEELEAIEKEYTINIENKDISDYSNELFSERESCSQMANITVDNDYIATSYVTVNDNEPNGHWSTDSYKEILTYFTTPGSVVQREKKEEKPYCYSLNTTISAVDNCYTLDSQFRAYTNYTDLQVSEFYNRLNDSGRTLLEELTNAGVVISKDYANLSTARGEGGDNEDPNNLYGIALTHSSGKTGGLIKKSWNTYTNLCYWDGTSRDDICKNRTMVWHGRNNTAVNKIAVLIP